MITPPPDARRSNCDLLWEDEEGNTHWVCDNGVRGTMPKDHRTTETTYTPETWSNDV